MKRNKKLRTDINRTGQLYLSLGVPVNYKKEQRKETKKE